MHESCPGIRTIPDEFISVTEDWEMFPPGTKGMFHKVRGLDEYINVAVQEKCFFSEIGVPWAQEVKSSSLTITNYDRFPSLH
jgi:hypothetical protein